MNRKNILVFFTFALTVSLAAWVVVDITKQHAQSGTGHSLSFGTHKAVTETTENSAEHDAAAHDASTNTEVSAAPQESAGTADTTDVKTQDSTAADEYKDVEFIQYTVKENDTVWKIATTFMPEYNAHPKDGKEGVIAYIVKENKLEKLADDNYHISTGQKLTIPKQKDIAANTSTNNSTTVKATAVAKKPATTKATTTKTTSSTAQNTSSNNTTGSSEVTTSATNTSDSTHTDHSAH